MHGRALEDPFQWLEDEKSEPTKAWMAAQDAFTRKMLGSLPLREKLTKRFNELYYIEAISAPRRHGDRFFLYRRSADQEKYSVYWKQGKDGEEKLLIDPATFSKDGTAALGGFSPSQDGKYVTYKVNENAADEATMYVMEVDTGKVSTTEVFPFARYASPSWLPENKGFYYTNLPKDPSVSVQDRPGLAEVRYHELGTDPARDPVIVPAANDPKKFVYVGTSRDGTYLFYIEQFGWTKQNVHWRRAGEKEWSPFAVGLDALFNIEAYDDHLYVSTNLGAPNQKVMKLAIPKKGLPTIDAAKEIIAEQPDFVIEDMRLIGGKLVAQRHEASSWRAACVRPWGEEGAGSGAPRYRLCHHPSWRTGQARGLFHVRLLHHPKPGVRDERGDRRNLPLRLDQGSCGPLFV